MNELQILSELESEFIINIKSAFQDRDFIYLGMDLFRGGDLRYHLIQRKFFSETEAKFMVACIIIGEFPSAIL